MPRNTDKRPLPARPARVLGVLLGLLGITASMACNAHDPKAVELSVVVDMVGISIPIPPPSLTSAPVQDVDLFGDITGEPAGARVILHELRGDLEYSSDIAEDGRFDFAAVTVDLTNNCFAVFVEVEEDGELLTGEAMYYTAEIAEDDQSAELVEAPEGCADDRVSSPLEGAPSTIELKHE